MNQRFVSLNHDDNVVSHAIGCFQYLESFRTTVGCAFVVLPGHDGAATDGSNVVGDFFITSRDCSERELIAQRHPSVYMADHGHTEQRGHGLSRETAAAHAGRN